MIYEGAVLQFWLTTTQTPRYFRMLTFVGADSEAGSGSWL